MVVSGGVGLGRQGSRWDVLRKGVGKTKLDAEVYSKEQEMLKYR